MEVGVNHLAIWAKQVFNGLEPVGDFHDLEMVRTDVDASSRGVDDWFRDKGGREGDLLL
jgi:hypothetical protein